MVPQMITSDIRFVYLMIKRSQARHTTTLPARRIAAPRTSSNFLAQRHGHKKRRSLEATDWRVIFLAHLSHCKATLPLRVLLMTMRLRKGDLQHSPTLDPRISSLKPALRRGLKKLASRAPTDCQTNSLAFLPAYMDRTH